MPRFNVDLTTELHEAFETKCHKEHCHMTDVARELIEKWVHSTTKLATLPAREMVDRDFQILEDMKARSKKYINGDRNT